MAGKTVNVYRIEYEKIPNFNSFTAFIAAFDLAEAVRHIATVVGPINIIAQGLHCRLDALSFPVRDFIIENALGKKKIKEEKVKEKIDK